MRMGWHHLLWSPQPEQGRVRGQHERQGCWPTRQSLIEKRVLGFSQDLWAGFFECVNANPTPSLLSLCRADSVYMPYLLEGKSSYLTFSENWEILSPVIWYQASVTGNKNVDFGSFLIWIMISFMVNNYITHASRAWVLSILKNNFFLWIGGWLYLPPLKTGLWEIALGSGKKLGLKSCSST